MQKYRVCVAINYGKNPEALVTKSGVCAHMPVKIL